MTSSSENSPNDTPTNAESSTGSTPTGNEQSDNNKSVIELLKKSFKDHPQRFSAAFAGLAFCISCFTYISTCRQINIAEKNLELANKAWIGFETVTLDTSKAESLMVSIRLRNFGESPAFKMRTGVIIKGTKSEKIDPWTDMPEMKAPVDLMPNGTISFNQSTKTMTIQTRRAIIDGKLILYVYGITEYDDIFDEHYQIEFCWRYVPKSTSITTQHEYYWHSQYKKK